jgi:plastocyanin
LLAAAVATLALAVTAGVASGDPPLPDPGFAAPFGSDVQHLHFRYGPLHVGAGHNLILIGPMSIEKPAYDGYVIGFKPNLVGPDGQPTRTDLLHLHHAAFLNLSRKDATFPFLPERFYATGEEKTVMMIPPPYGYFVRGSDVWGVSYMLHNQTPQEQVAWITYDIDFVPASSALGRRMKAVTPIWMDVQNGQAYPVFDVHRGTGANGRFTYPEDQRPYPYTHGLRLNEWTVPHDGTLVAAAGHIHPGGMYNDLDVIRDGARAPVSPVVVCSRPAKRVRRGHRARRRSRVRHRSHVRRRGRRARSHGHRAPPARRPSCRTGPSTEIVPGHEPSSVRIFRSAARYFDPDGPISWDLAMTRTADDWRVGLKKGDRLAISSTYETARASWYENMGIIVAFFADGSGGPDPFRQPVDQNGYVTHGHLPENGNYGGQPLAGAPDPASLPAGPPVANAAISGFNYLPGGFGLTGAAGLPPVIRQGQQLTFDNADYGAQIFHTITACRQPCNRSTGLDYPIANGPIDFDSGDLGYGPTGYTIAAQRENWSTPASLPAGTYTYFCRIHPFMRGSFRVVVR